ncbi:DUF1989 domain-containing protein [Salinigranum sp. GCM10025319]|uniref:DUF1989 domain-containing protein n=1 Tax=Salinigranum sp. GCM10025319 TaxID=3252687 RepID=UPI00360CDF84
MPHHTDSGRRDAEPSGTHGGRYEGIRDDAYHQGDRPTMHSSLSYPFEYTIQAREGAAVVVEEGKTMRITDVEGGQIVDFVIYNHNNLRERFDQARTKANQGKFLVTTGDHLYSKSNGKMMTLTADTYGTHDMQWGMCNKGKYESEEFMAVDETDAAGDAKFEDVPEWGCWESLGTALEPWGIRPEDIPSPINLFQTMEYDLDTGEVHIIPSDSDPGDYVDLRAEMDCLVGVSACPWTSKPVKVEVFDDE